MAVENHSPAKTNHLIDEIARNLLRVRDFSRSGLKVEHLRKNTRRIVVRKRFFVFYASFNDQILAFRILHGSRLMRPEDFEW